MRLASVLAAGLALVCATRSASAPLDNARFRCRQDFDDLSLIGRHLIDGDLKAAMNLAFMLTRPHETMCATCEEREVARRADALAAAQTVPAAIRAEVQLAAACAGCHRALRVPPLSLPEHAPPDLPTIPAQMARHQWAADRLWEGLAAPSDLHWTSGLYVLANSNIAAIDRDHPVLAKRMETQARTALARRHVERRPRSEVFRELLVTCWQCHTRKPARSR